MCDTDKCCRVKEEGISSIKKDRGCTDVLFLLLWVAALGGTIACSAIASNQGGNVQKIIRGKDMSGNVCGYSEAVKTKPLLAWPNPFEPGYGICVESCAETSNKSSLYMAALYESESYLGRYCALSSSTSKSLATDAFSAIKANEDVSQIFGDLLKSWPMLLISAFIATFFALIFLYIIKAFAAYLFAVCVAGLLVGGVLTGALLITTGLNGQYSKQLSNFLVGVGITTLVLTLLFILALCFLRVQVQIAIEVVREASSALLDMKTVLMFPIIPWLLFVGYAAYWVVVVLNIFSVTQLVEKGPTPASVTTYGPQFLPTTGQNQNPTISYELEIVQSWKNVFAYVFFHLLWMVQTAFYFCFLVLSGAIADWYFTPRDGAGNKIRGENEGELTRWPVMKSLERTLRYHAGTVALAALIIAIIQFTRACVKYIEKRVLSEPPNTLKKAILCCINCFLACMECCCDKINKNALIWTAVYGDSFPTAACSSFALVWRNLARVAALSTVSSGILHLAELAVAALTAGIGAVVLTFGFKYDLLSIFIPVIFIAIIGWAVARIYFSLVDAAIDTLFLCFLIDAEVNPAGCMLASQQLQELVGKYQNESEKDAGEEQRMQAKRKEDIRLT